MLYRIAELDNFKGRRSKSYLPLPPMDKDSCEKIRIILNEQRDSESRTRRFYKIEPIESKLED